MFGAIAFAGVTTITTLTTTNSNYAASFTGNTTEVTNDTNFLNTGAITLGDDGDMLMFAGGLATTGNVSNPSVTNVGGSPQRRGHRFGVRVVRVVNDEHAVRPGGPGHALLGPLVRLTKPAANARQIDALGQRNGGGRRGIHGVVRAHLRYVRDDGLLTVAQREGGFALVVQCDVAKPDVA